jgi:hypothetical protein
MRPIAARDRELEELSQTVVATMRAVPAEIQLSRNKYNNRLVAAAPLPEPVWRLPVLPTVLVVFLALMMLTLRDDATNPFKRAGLESRIGY